MASAMIWPTAESLLAEMLPTWATEVESSQGWDMPPMEETAAVTALSMPRLRSIGFMPAATDLSPSVRMDCASTVAVVVPSPASSDV